MSCNSPEPHPVFISALIRQANLGGGAALWPATRLVVAAPGCGGGCRAISARSVAGRGLPRPVVVAPKPMLPPEDVLKNTRRPSSVTASRWSL